MNEDDDRTAGPGPACDAVAVRRRAKAGLAMIAVAAVVALLTLAGAGATMLVTGLVPLPGLEGRITAAVEERLGPQWRVEAGQAELGRIDGQSQLRIRQVSFRHSSGATLRAPEAVLGYVPLALLTGQIRLVSIDLRGVNLRMGVNQDGALVLNADEASAAPPVTPALPDPGQWNAFAAAMAAISTLAQGDGLLGSLETAGMRGARLTLIDPEGRQRAGLEDVDIRLTRGEPGSTRLTMKGRTGERWKELAINLTADAQGGRRAEIEIVRFEPAAMIGLALGSGAAAIDGLSMAGVVSLAQTAAGVRSVTARIDVQPGLVDFGAGPAPPLRIDGAHFAFETGDDVGDIRVSRAELRSGGTLLKGAGTLRDDGGAWRMNFEAGGQIAGAGQDQDVVVDRLAGVVVYDAAASAVRVEALSVRGPLLDVEATGRVARDAEGLSQQIAVGARNSAARALLAVWPAWTSPELHATLSLQIAAGSIEALSVALDLSAPDHGRLLAGEGLPDASLALSVTGDQVQFLPGEGLPPVVQARVVGTASGRRVQLAVESAEAVLGGGRSLALSEGSFSIPEIWVRRAPARIKFRSTGSVEALAALFAFPALDGFGPQGLEPASLRGRSDLTTVLELPLAGDLRPEEVAVQSSGSLSGVGSDTLLGAEKLEGANLTVKFDRDGLLLRGEGRVAGERAQIELRQNPKGQGEAALSVSLDNNARKKWGLGPEAGVNGVVQARVVKPLGKAVDAMPRVEIDFARAAIDFGFVSPAKPAGRPGKASFSYLASADGPVLDDFQFEAGSVLVRGKVALNRQNGFVSASLSQARLSPGDNLKLEARREGGVIRATVRGAVADARPFIKDLQGVPSAGRSQGAGSGDDLDLDLEVPILTGFNNEAISGAVLKLSKRDGAIRSLTFDGKIGRGALTMKQTRQGEAAGPLVVQSENGGGLLRFFDLYRRANGGDLVLSLGAAGARQGGELLFRNFIVRDEPALRRVLAPAAAADGSAAGPIDASEVAFTKLRAEFTRSANRLDVSDMVIWGQQIGFTLQGSVDYGRDRVDIGGTFVPGYAFNNAFAQVPVLGALLGGGSQYGGLFAVNFRLSGSASAPTMTINPLSAIAPGILRRFVDPLGGAPLDQPTRPSSQRGESNR